MFHMKHYIKLKGANIMAKNNHKSNELLLIEVLKATDKELVTMYVKGSNKFAMREMKIRGIY